MKRGKAMAKKPTKKEAPAAKAKKTAKPAAKAAKPAAKASKPAKPAAKPAAKAAKSAVKEAVKAPTKAAPKAPAAKAKPVGDAKPAKAVAAAKPAKVEPKAVAPEEKKSKKAQLILVKDDAKEEIKAVAQAPAPKEKKEKKEKKSKAEKAGAADDMAKWSDLHERYKSVKAVPYSISAQFEAKTPIQHKIFGWGYILSNEYDRLEVLFEDGKRMLISNRNLS
jgi:hypothetical protein